MNFTTQRDPLESCQNLVKSLLEALLAAEFCLFRERELAAGRKLWRNGYAQKTLRGRFGEFSIRVPRDRAGLFRPIILRKRHVLLRELDELCMRVFTLYNGPREERLTEIGNLLSRFYNDASSRDDVRILLKALIRGCRSHKRALSTVDYGPVDPGVRFRYDGLSATTGKTPATPTAFRTNDTNTQLAMDDEQSASMRVSATAYDERLTRPSGVPTFIKESVDEAPTESASDPGVIKARESEQRINRPENAERYSLRTSPILCALFPFSGTRCDHAFLYVLYVPFSPANSRLFTRGLIFCPHFAYLSPVLPALCLAAFRPSRPFPPTPSTRFDRAFFPPV